MKIKICLLALAVAAFGAAALEKKADAASFNFQTQQNATLRCTVINSENSPLNVRSSPNGKRIISKLKNGTTVFVEYFSGDAQDRSWAEVRLSRKRNAKPLGWVLQDFLDCE